MATAEEFRLLIQERLRALDSSISLEDGSPADVQVVEPLVRRFEPDALETNMELLIRTRLLQEFPNLHTGEGNALSDALVKPMRVLLEPFVREIRAIRRNQTLIDPTILNKDEADSLVSNLFIRRNTGDYAKVTVRAYFENPVSANIGGINVAFTAGGRRFRPTTPQSITTEAMLLNTDGELFYFDIDYVAEGIGDAYNVAASQIIGITNLPAATRVTNMARARGGLNEEATIEMVARAEQSVGERSLTTIPGSVAVLFEQFTDLRLLQIIGFNDAEMQRDIIKGGNLGDVLIFNTDGETDDDGDGDGYTPYFDAVSTPFAAALGPAGTDISEYVLTVWFNRSGVMTPQDWDLKEVISSGRIQISDDYLGDSRLPEAAVDLYWTIRDRVLTLSDIPGGILFPGVGGATVNVPSDEVHVGGVSDFYVAGPVPSDETLALSLYGTSEPALRGNTARTFTDNRIWIYGSTLADYLKIRSGVTSIRLLSGNSTGTYRVIGAVWNDPVIELEVHQDTLDSEFNLLFDATDSIDIDLVDPKEILAIGSDLRTYAGSDFVDTSSGTVWADLGVGTGNVLEILNGSDAGEYDIGSVSGASMYLGNPNPISLSQTDGPLQYRILNKQDAGIELPLVRVTSVELLDSSLEPTGDYIPYRHPVDIQSRSFQNPGRGTKAGTNDVTTDDLLSVDPGADPNKLTSDNTGIDYYALGVRPGDIVNINTGDNRGYYTVASDGVGGAPAAAVGLLAYELRVVEDLVWVDAAMTYEVGEPSYGSFRLHFLEPTSVKVTADGTAFSVDIGGGVIRNFKPDGLLFDEYLPSDLTIPTFEAAAGNSTVELWTPGGGTGNEINTAQYGVIAEDRVEVTFAPIVGDKDHSGTTVFTDGTVRLDLGDGTETVRLDGTLDIDAIVDQFNTQLSRSVATKWENGGSKFFAIRSDQEVTLIDNSSDASDVTDDVFGTTPGTNNPWLNDPAGVGVFATFAGETIPNDSPYKGFLFVTGVSANSMTLEDAAGSAFNPTWPVNAELGHYIVISRPGQQSITSTQMNDQQDDLGLYYFDVECSSEGHGDSWNIAADLQATATGYDADGWDVSTQDENLSFSMAEEPWLHITPRVLLTGADNDPTELTELVGLSFQVSYERSDLVEEVHTFIRDQQNRVVCQNPLARHLTPIFVRTFIQYSGGGSESDVRTELVSIIEDVVPERRLEVSDLTAEVSRQGASSILMPVTLIGIKHNTDRTITVERSQDSISTERLSSMIPDDDGTTTEGASWIQLNRT